MRLWTSKIAFCAAMLAVSAVACGPASPGGGGDGDGDGDGDIPGETPMCIDSEECESPSSICVASIVGRPVLRRLTAREFEAALTDVFPEIAGQWTSTFSADPVSELGFDNDAAKLVVSKQTAREIDSTGKSVADAVSAGLEGMLPCTAVGDRACAGTFLDTYGKRLFRRPLNDAEREKYLAFFDQALAEPDVEFPTAVGWLTRALIHAPATVYRREIGEKLAGSRSQFTQYEIATALAFTYAGTTPGDALLEMADAGELNSPEVLVGVAMQLLDSPQGHEQIHRFFESSLEYGRVSTLTKANAPEFESLRDQMRLETRAYIEEVVINRRGGIRELLTAPVTFPTAALATFYGLPAPANDYAEVARPAGMGVGILAQGSLLSTEASANSSSPTQRGLLVLEKLLCRELPQVPPTVPDIPEPIVGQITTRQRYEEQHATGGCANCHKNFDPMGFGLEHFDEAGRFRADEGGLTIDSSGSVASTEVVFTDQEGLASGLAELEEVQACVSGQLKTFSYGGSEPCWARPVATNSWPALSVSWNTSRRWRVSLTSQAASSQSIFRVGNAAADSSARGIFCVESVSLLQNLRSS